MHAHWVHGALFATVMGTSGCLHAQAAPAPRSPAPATAPIRPASRAAVRAMLDSVVDHPRFRNAQWGVLVVDPGSGDTLYSYNAHKLFMPASNEKVVTAAVALTLLGPDFKFTTRVAMRGVQRDTVLDGDIVVFGTGDPTFSDHIRRDALIPLREMADSVRAHGIHYVDGRLRRGTPLFTDAALGYGWEWNDLGIAFGAPVGDLMFNDAFARTTVTVDGVPDTSHAKLPPFRNFLDAFDGALKQRGVRTLIGWDWTTTVADSGLTTLFTYESPPLRDILPHFLKPSQNQIGEILLKTLGRMQTGIATSDSGAAVVARTLRAWGVDSSAIVVHDGSGLSRHDLVSPEALVRVLDQMRRDSTFGAYYAALPIAGVDGTLEYRLRGTAAALNAHAKTGSMDRVRAMSGYVTSADGRLLEFSLIANDWTVPGAEVDATLDRIVAHLAALHVGG